MDEMILLGVTKNGLPVSIVDKLLFEIEKSGMSAERLIKAISELEPDKYSSYLLKTVDLKDDIVINPCVSITKDDNVKLMRGNSSNEEDKIPCVYRESPELTSLANVGIYYNNGWTVFKASNGEIVPPYPWQKGIYKDEIESSKEFWNTHARVPDALSATKLNMINKMKNSFSIGEDAMKYKKRITGKILEWMNPQAMAQQYNGFTHLCNPKSEFFKYLATDKNGRPYISPYYNPDKKSVATLSSDIRPGDYVICDDLDNAPNGGLGFKFISSRCQNFDREICIQVNGEFYTIAKYMFKKTGFLKPGYMHVKKGVIHDLTGNEPFDKKDFIQDFMKLLKRIEHNPNAKLHEYDVFVNDCPELTYKSFCDEAHSIIYDFLSEDIIKLAKNDLGIDKEIDKGTLNNHPKVSLLDRQFIETAFLNRMKNEREKTGDINYRELIKFNEYEKEIIKKFCTPRHGNFYSRYNVLNTPVGFRYRVNKDVAPSIIFKIREKLYGDVSHPINPVCITEDKENPFKPNVNKICYAYTTNDYSEIKEELNIKDIEPNVESEYQYDEENYEEPEVDDDLEL